MLKTRRAHAAAKVIPPVVAGSLFLLGCSAPRPAPMAAAPRPVFTINTPLDVIAADPRGKAVLVRDMPGMMSNSKYQLFDDMSLAQIAIISGGRIKKAKLEQVQEDLAKLAAP